jgi:hypothetical protein
MSESEEFNRMDCSRFREVLHDLDRPEMRGVALRELALTHAEACYRCAYLITESEALDSSLRTLANRSANLQAPSRVESAVLAEFRRQKASMARGKMLLRIAVLATAAAVLLTLGLSLHYRGKLSVITPSAHGPVASSAASSVAGEGITEVADNKSADQENATDFVPLPSATDPGTLEGGAVVRVLLSRAALASLGLPVANMGAAEQVPADILLSEDGAPQAIRLVSQEQVDYSVGPTLASWGETNAAEK